MSKPPSYFGIRDDIEEKGYNKEETDNIMGPLSELTLGANNAYYEVVSEWLAGNKTATQLMMDLLKVWSAHGSALGKLGELVWKDEKEVPDLDDDWSDTVSMPKVEVDDD